VTVGSDANVSNSSKIYWDKMKASGKQRSNRNLPNLKQIEVENVGLGRQLDG
jgi:hypothetical protein